MTTLLIAEHDHANLKDATNKALTAATQLGGDVHVLVAGGGEGTKAAAEAAAKLQEGFRIPCDIEALLGSSAVLTGSDPIRLPFRRTTEQLFPKAPLPRVGLGR